MTKKDFELIAGVIKDTAFNCPRNNHHDAGYDMAHRHIARDMAKALARTNPRFDSDRFLRACGVE